MPNTTASSVVRIRLRDRPLEYGSARLVLELWLEVPGNSVLIVLKLPNRHCSESRKLWRRRTKNLNFIIFFIFKRVFI